MSSSSSSGGGPVCPGPPAGGPTSTWADCGVGLDPTKQGGDLLWTQAVGLWQGNVIVGCEFPAPPTFQLALGSTGDAALGILGCNNSAQVGVQQFNGSGTDILNGSWTIPVGWDVVQTFGIDRHGDLVVYDDFDVGLMLEDTLDVFGPSGPSVSWTNDEQLAGAPYPLPFRLGPAWDSDTLGNFFTVVVVAYPFGNPTSIDIDSTLTLPLGSYLVRGGAMGESFQANFSGSFAADRTGGVYRFDALPATLDLGCGPMVPVSSSSAYVARFDPSWGCVFSRVLPAAVSIVADMGGGAVLSATSASSLDLGCGALAAASGGSTFVTRLDPAGGCLFGASLPAPGLTVALDPGGNVVLSGTVGPAPVDLGGGPLAPLGNQDFVRSPNARQASSGNFLWSRRFGGAGIVFASPASVSTSASGDVYLLTGWSGAVDLGGGPVSAATGDTVVGSFSSTGAYRWSRAYTFPADAQVGVDGCGALVVGTMTDFDPGCGHIFPAHLGIGCTSLADCPYTAVARFAP